MSTEGHTLKAGTAGSLDEHLRGIYHAHEGRYEDAIEAFERATELDPEMAGSYVELGMAYACRGEYARMLEALRQAVEIDASAVRSYLGEQPLGDLPSELTPDALAMSHLAAGRDDEAARVLEPARSEKPGSAPPVAVTLLALSYLLRGEGVEMDEEGVRRGCATAGM